MIPLARFMKNVVTHGYYVVRWCASEFLPMATRSTLSSRLAEFCRLLGLVTIVLIMAFETDGFATKGLPGTRLAWVLDGIVAILIGNVAKEFAIAVCSRVMNWLGLDFYRKGVMLNGRVFSEIVRSDGTWRRCEFGKRETVCEWTDRFGACNRSVTGPRLEA